MGLLYLYKLFFIYSAGHQRECNNYIHLSLAYLMANKKLRTIGWGQPQFCGAVHNRTETIMLKTQSQLGNGMLSAPHLSTVISLNQFNRAVVIPDRANKM